MATDDADGPESPALEGTVAESPDQGEDSPDGSDSTFARVGEYTWEEFLREYGTENDARTLYENVTQTPDNTRWDDGETGRGRPTLEDWARVETDPTDFLGFHPVDVDDVVGAAGSLGESFDESFESFCDPETTRVALGEYFWEHYKREYYYEDDGGRPRDKAGDVVPFDGEEALGFAPEVTGEAVTKAASRANELAAVLNERTVDTSYDEEDAFFTDANGHTTVANRYDLEKTVPLEKKHHFREVERYWVNKPYSFVIIFHSTKENEKKYYVVQPYMNRIESDLVEFLEGKLRTAIKYSDKNIVGDGDGTRKRVIEEQTYELLERYNLYELPNTDDGTSWLGGLFGSGDDPTDGGTATDTSGSGDGGEGSLLGKVGIGGGSGDGGSASTNGQTASAASAPSGVDPNAPALDSTDGQTANAGELGESDGDTDGAPALEAGSNDRAAGGETDLPATVEDEGGDVATRDAAAPDADTAGEETPALEGDVTAESGTPSAGVAEREAASDRSETGGSAARPSSSEDHVVDGGGDDAGLFARLFARLKAMLGAEETSTTRQRRGLDGIAARPEPAVLEDDAAELSEYQIEKLLYVLKRDFVGYERIDGIKHDINVEDISCDGYNSPVFVYHSDYEQIITNIYHDVEELDDFVVKLAQRSGKGISKRRPQVDATLPDGSRAQLTLGKEVSDHGTNYTIRQFKDVPFTPIDLINWNTFSLDQMGFLWLCIENNKSLIFAGGTASGKTTSLNAVSLFIPSSSKIVSIEDTREVELPQRNWIASVTRPSFSEGDKGDIDEFDLLEAALRQRPEYIVMGEIRGEEGRTLFQVMSTGHTTYTTFHADSVGEVLKRFTTDPINVSKTMFTALDLVSIQTSTRVGGNKVRRNKSLTEINHYDPENDEINVQDVYQWQAETDEYLHMGSSNTLEEIRFDRGWTRQTLDQEIFKRQVVLAYLLENGLNTYTQVAATFQAFINDQDTILALIADDGLERSLEDLREMESVLIDIDPEKEEMVPRPDAPDEVLEQARTILERAEDELFDEYRGTSSAGVVEALQSVGETPAPDVTAEPGTQHELDALAEEAEREALDAGDEQAALEEGTNDGSEPPALGSGGDDDVEEPRPSGAGNAPDATGSTAVDEPESSSTAAASGSGGRTSNGGDLGDVFGGTDDPWLEDEETDDVADRSGDAADRPNTEPAADTPKADTSDVEPVRELDDPLSDGVSTDPAAGQGSQPTDGSMGETGADTEPGSASFADTGRDSDSAVDPPADLSDDSASERRESETSSDDPGADASDQPPSPAESFEVTNQSAVDADDDTGTTPDASGPFDTGEDGADGVNDHETSSGGGDTTETGTEVGSDGSDDGPDDSDGSEEDEAGFSFGEFKDPAEDDE